MLNVTKHLYVPSFFLINPDVVLQNAMESLRWFRSREGKEGPYCAITDTVAAPATLYVPRREPYALVGTDLVLHTVDENYDPITLTVTFTGTDPLSAQDVCDAINLASPPTGGVVATVDGGHPFIATRLEGIRAYVQVEKTLGSTRLGFYGDESAHGLDKDTEIQGGRHTYTINDYHSNDKAWYTVRQVNSLGFRGESYPAFPLDDRRWAVQGREEGTIVGYVRLFDLEGFPMEGAGVTILNKFRPNTVSMGGVTGGIFRHTLYGETDNRGIAYFRLLRGTEVDVVILGSGTTRSIRVPDDPAIDAFDLLDPSLNTTDEYGIRTPNIPFAIKTTF